MATRTPLAELERSLATVSRLLSDRATTEDLARRCGYHLPPASWALLEHLDTHGGLRVSAIAACHGVDVSTITPRLKRLETAGLVERERATDDARAFVITITDEGSRALDSIHAERRKVLDDALRGIDESDLARTAEVLGRLAAYLTPQQPPGRP